MRSMVARAWCEPRDLELVELPDPEPGPDQVAVDVSAIGCNFFDILMVQGKYQIKPPFPFAPGAEVAGTIRARGAEAAGFAPGDRVLALTGWGGFSSVALAPASDVFRIPRSMSFDDGAAFGIVYQTSYFGLVHRANLRPGETLLVHAAAGGVGLAAVQIGRALGARVLATASSPAKREVALVNGAEAAFDYTSPDWVERVNKATTGHGADVIYDPVGGDVFDLSTKCTAFGGRLLVVGFASGRIPTIAANRILLKNISIVGLHWGAYRKHDPARVPQAMTALFGMYERGAVRPVIGSIHPLSEAAQALEEIATRRSVGKVVLHP
ncbi:MAG: NADPH:quinone oxidoreductase [Acidobacteria bacterium]|nr:MAG: NADPH:quinone oxidoreductase [Acidobacteriota bacterium]